MLPEAVPFIYLSAREASLTLTPDLAFFNGHFPEAPVLPGAIILQISLDFLRSLNDRGTVIPVPDIKSGVKIKDAKFSGVVKPNIEFILSAEESRTGATVKWRESGGNTVVASITF